MSSQQTILQQMLADDLSSTFLKEYSRRIVTIYQEAYSRSVKDDDIDDSLKRYYLGQSRYALIQSLFVSVGRECGHQTEIVPCEQNGFPILVVTIGRFKFTTHHGYNPEEMSVLNSSLIRKQHSAINEELVQPKLFGSTFNAEKLAAAEKIFANIIFSCRSDVADFQNYGFLRIAIPYLRKVNNKDKLFYAENHDFNDILKMVVEKERKEQQGKPMVNIAVPKIKISNNG